MRRNALRAIVVVFSVFCMCAAQTVQGQQPPVLARVFVAKDATDSDVLRIRDNIIAFGGVIKGYALGEVFVAAVPPEMLAVIESVQKVAKVDLVPTAPAFSAQRRLAAAPLTASELAGLMPKNCLPTPTAEQAERLAQLVKPAPEVAPTSFSQRRSLLSATPGVPPSVDNSLSPHFPPIGDQEGRSSCVAWAAGYYWSTYTQAVDEGLDVSGVWLPRDPPCDILTDGKYDPVKGAACLLTIKDPPRPSRAVEHIASPAFLYPLIHTVGYNNSVCTDDAGAFITQAMSDLSTWGIGNWQMKPYDPWKYDSMVYEWPAEEQWVEALSRRTAETFSFQISQQSEFDKLKQHLANGNIAVAGFQQYENLPHWGWDRLCQSQAGVCPGIDDDVLYSNTGSTWLGGHAITIVGYDDNKEYFDAEAGQFKQGALLVANSATPDWGIANTAGGQSKGFFWMAYDYARANLYEVTYNSDRPSYRPRLYGAANVAAADRSSGSLSGGVGFQSENFYAPPPYAKYVSDNIFPGNIECTARPIEPDKRLVFDLTDGLFQIDPKAAVPLLFVSFRADPGGTIGQTDFYYDWAGNGSFTRYASPDPVKATSIYVADGVMCTNVMQSGDLSGDGVVDRTDISLITAALSRPAQCKSDTRDMDRDSRVTVLDARKAALRCTYRGCTAK